MGARTRRARPAKSTPGQVRIVSQDSLRKGGEGRRPEEVTAQLSSEGKQMMAEVGQEGGAYGRPRDGGHLQAMRLGCPGGEERVWPEAGEDRMRLLETEAASEMKRRVSSAGPGRDGGGLRPDVLFRAGAPSSVRSWGPRMGEEDLKQLQVSVAGPVGQMEGLRQA